MGQRLLSMLKQSDGTSNTLLEQERKVLGEFLCEDDGQESHVSDGVLDLWQQLSQIHSGPLLQHERVSSRTFGALSELAKKQVCLSFHQKLRGTLAHPKAMAALHVECR